MDIKELVSLEVVDAKYIPEGIAILFDDGVILVVTDEGYSISTGTRWEEDWAWITK